MSPFWRALLVGLRLMAIGASLVSAVVLLAILLTVLPAPRNGVTAPKREAAPGAVSPSAKETPPAPQELPQNSARVARARAEARENRQLEQQADQ